MSRTERILVLGGLGLALVGLGLRLLAPPRLALPLQSAAAAAPDPTGDLAARLERGRRPLALDANAAQSFRTEVEREAGGLGSVEEVHPPLDFQASPIEGGIQLSWVADPRNPVEGLHYRLTRWAGDGGGEELPPTSLSEFLDRVPCEGVPYRYRLQAEIRREIAAGAATPRWETRASEPAGATCTLPRHAEWSAEGLDAEGRIRLTLRRPGHPELGPFPVAPGQEIGITGWFLDGLTLRETSQQVETRIPRFDALGRRVIIGGRPADRTRLVTVTPLLASLRLSDPCGASLAVELLLPVDSSSVQGG